MAAGVRMVFDNRAIRRAYEQSSTARQLVDRAATHVEETAEGLAGFSLHAETGIARRSGRDSLGVYADVGYDKTERGWHLFFWEVGTVHHGARPHLRDALRRPIRF